MCLGSFDTYDDALAAKTDPQFRGKLRAELGKLALPRTTCAWCPPESTTPKCSGKYTGHVQDGVIALDGSVIMNEGASFAVELEVIDSISISLQCGVCTPQVR